MAEEQRQVRMDDIDPEQAMQLFSAFAKVARILLRGLLIAGIGVSGYAGTILWEAESSKDWPTVQGKVVTASLDQRVFGGRRIERLNFRYAYTVNGKPYSGNRVTIGPRVGPLAPRAMDVVAEYRRRPDVTVFYSPDDPSRSVLKPGATQTVFFIAAIGPLMVIISFWFLQGLERSEAAIRNKYARSGGVTDRPVSRTAAGHPKIPASVIGPKPIEPGSDEGTRRRVIVVLIAVLIALVIAGFYRGEVERWLEKMRREFGYSGQHRVHGIYTAEHLRGHTPDTAERSANLQPAPDGFAESNYPKRTPGNQRAIWGKMITRIIPRH